MSFVSLEFLLFFVITLTLLIFVKKSKYRLPLILIANLLFYAFGGGFIALGIFCVIIGYFYAFGFLLKKHNKKFTLIVGIILSLIPLFVFKYLQYILKISNIHLMDSFFGTIGVPLGISFFTLQGISYFVDIYSGKVVIEKNPFYLGIYLSLFSTVTSGPFESSNDIFNQLKNDYIYNHDQIVDGLKNMALGLFLKMFISESLGFVINHYYNAPATNYFSIWLLISTIFFAFQLYADFYGYSLIAKGTAETIGIELVDNFHQPYLSSSISSFWSRWHISFQKWLTRYIYIPLGGSRVKTPRILLNIMIVFLISGLWHGSGLTFIVWGALNGIYVCLERLFHLNKKSKSGWRRIVGFIYTFVFITISWIFFRANSISDAGIIFKQIFVGIPSDLFALIKGSVSIKSFIPTQINVIIRFIFSILGIAFICVLDINERKKGSLALITQKWNKIAKYVFYIALICIAVGLGVWGGTSQFMYAQF